MDMNLQTMRGVTFLAVSEKIDADTCIELRDWVMDALTRTRNFIIKLTDVPSMDSTAIGTLMSLVQEVQLMDGEVKFVGLNKNLRRIFQLVNAERVFDIYDTTQEALKALGIGADVCTPPSFMA